MKAATTRAVAAAVVAAVALAAAVHAPPAAAERVGIIGAGMAGLAAAVELQQRGVTDFVILEAADRIGGRLQKGAIGEKGANWVQGLEGNPVWELVQRYNVSGALQDWDDVTSYFTNGTEAPDSSVRWDDFDEALGCAGELAAEISGAADPAAADLDVGAALGLCGWTPRTPLDYSVQEFSEDYEWAESARETSAGGTQEYLTYSDFEDADYFVHDEVGFEKIAAGYADEFLPDGWRASHLRLGDAGRVTRIDTNCSAGAGARVTVADGTAHEFDRVISTLPLGVLQHDWDDLFAGSPAAGEARRRAVFKLRLGDYNKLKLRFAPGAAKFWKNSTFWLQPHIHGPTGDSVWHNLDLQMNETGVVFLTATGSRAAFLESFGDDDIQAILVAKLKLTFGDDNVPTPVEVDFARWRSDPLTRGAFSNIPAGFTAADYDAAFGTPVGGAVYLSGEHACRRINGYVHSALAAGVRDARRVLRDLGLGGDSVPDDVTFCERAGAGVPGLPFAVPAAPAAADKRGPHRARGPVRAQRRRRKFRPVGDTPGCEGDPVPGASVAGGGGGSAEGKVDESFRSATIALSVLLVLSVAAALVLVVLLSRAHAGAKNVKGTELSNIG